jgi:hypothetical protein
MPILREVARSRHMDRDEYRGRAAVALANGVDVYNPSRRRVRGNPWDWELRPLLFQNIFATSVSALAIKESKSISLRRTPSSKYTR